MIDFEFVSPTKIIFGCNAEMKVGEVISSYNFKKVLIVYGGSSAVKSGLLKRVEDKLTESNITYVELGGVKPNPVKELVERGKKVALDEDIEIILAIGGGSVIDTAKAIGVNRYYDGDVMDFHTGKAKPSKSLPIGVILTLAAAGSELSDSCVISDEEKKIKAGFHNDVVRPLFAIENPELTFSCPPYQTAAGIVDMMSHSLERFMCPSSDYQIADDWALAVCKRVIEAGLVVMKNPNDYDARGALMLLSGIGHNGLTSLSKKTSLTVHGPEHALSAYKPTITHGAGIGVCYLGWAKAFLKEMTPKLAKAARYLFEINVEDDTKAAMIGIERMESFLKTINMPTTLKELGINESDLDACADLASANGTRTVGLCPQPLDREAVLKIYKHCL